MGDSYTVVLDRQPTASVTVTVAGHSGTDVSLSAATLTFTTANWDTAQTVTVTAGNDSDTADDSVTLTHTATSTDGNYNGIMIASVAVTVEDNDTAQVAVHDTDSHDNDGDSSDGGSNLREPVPSSTYSMRSGATSLGDVTEWSPPQFVDGELDGSNGVVDYFSFSLTSTKLADIELRKLSFDADLFLEDSLGVVVSSSENAGTSNEWISIGLQEGDYFVRVVAKQSGANTYRLWIGTSDAPQPTVSQRSLPAQSGDGTADDVPGDQTSGESLHVGQHWQGPGDLLQQKGRLDFAGDADWFGLRLEAWQKIKFKATDWPVQDAQGMLLLEARIEGIYDNAGTRLASSTSAGQRKVFTPSASGLYFVAVAASADHVGDYLLSVQWMLPPGGLDATTAGFDSPASVDVGESLQETIRPHLDVDWIKVDLVAGNVYRLEVRGKDSDGGTLVDPELTAIRVNPAEQAVFDAYDDAGRLHSDYDGRIRTNGLSRSEIDMVPTAPDPSASDPESGFTDAHDFDDGVGQDAWLLFRPAATGSHWIVVESQGGFSGTYTVSGHLVDVEEGNQQGGQQRQTALVFYSQSLGIGEAGSGAFSVQLATQPVHSVTVAVASDDIGAATVSPVSLAFSTGNWGTPQTVTVSGVNDSDIFNEDLIVNLTAASTDADYQGKTASVSVSVLDNDEAGVSISETALTIEEGETGTYTVMLDTEPTDDVTVTIGGAGIDLSLDKPTLTFTAANWDTEQTVTVTAVDDAIDDDGETLTLTHAVASTSDSDYDGIAAAGVAVLITDDDVPAVTVSFEQASYTVAEGSSVTVKVTLNADPERSVSIPITKTDQGGGTSADYSGVPSSVTFNSGDTEKSIHFAAADSVNDDGESVKLGFGTLPTGVSAGTTAETTISITDDDVPAVTVSFEQASYTVAEGSSVTVKVTLNADPERSVSIPITKANQDGATNADYSVPASVTIASGQMERTFTFIANQDNANDDGESVKLGFGTLPTGVSAGTTAETTVSITDDDVPAVTVSFKQASYTVAEGSSVTVKVTLNADPERAVTIPITKTDQGGGTSVDYSGVPSSVTFNSGDTKKSIHFAAAADSVDDDGESVKLGLGTLPTGVSAGMIAETTVSITDDDVPAVTVSFEQASYTVGEGNIVSVKIKLDTPPERTVTIPLTETNQDGASAADYSGVPNSVTFTSSQNERIINFSATQDTIDDDVPPVTPRFEHATYTVAEGSSVTVKVTLSADPERAVTIPITKTDQGGGTSADYSGVPGSVTFGSSETTKSFTVTADDDSDDDDLESVTLGFGSLPERVSAGNPAQAVVNITDNDATQKMLTVSFDADNSIWRTVRENGSSYLGVSLDRRPGQGRAVTIPLVVTYMGGASAADITGVPANVTFGARQREAGVVISAVDDTYVERGEGFKVSFGTLPDGVAEYSRRSRATYGIVDNDSIPVLRVANASAGEWPNPVSFLRFVVTLNRSAVHEVRVDYRTVNGTAVAGQDYKAVSGTLVFREGERSKTVWVEVIYDSVDEGIEDMTVELSNPVRAHLSKGTATGRISDFNR